MANLTQLKAWLADAENQHHLLVTGSKPKVIVDHDGQRMEYAFASLSQLAKYIENLKRKIAELDGSAACLPKGPMKIWM